jgi:hypothetical protein
MEFRAELVWTVLQHNITYTHTHTHAYTDSWSFEQSLYGLSCSIISRF